MQASKLFRLLAIGVMTTVFTLGIAGNAMAAGAYRYDQIVWTKDPCTSNWDIWSMNDTGGAQARLTFTDMITEEHPVWTDDATKIVYVRYLRGNSPGAEIWKMDANGGNQEKITGPYAHHPYVFGDQIYYNKVVSGVREIWRIGLDGSGDTAIISNPAADTWHPTVATNGGDDYLVYVQGDLNVEPDNTIYYYNLTTSTGPTVFLAPPGVGDNYAPSITPDGDFVLYSVGGSLLPLVLWKRDFPSGANPTQLTTIANDVTPYTNSTATNEITFARINGMDAEIRRINFDGSNPLNLSQDVAALDVFVVERSGCGPLSLHKGGSPRTKPVVMGFMAVLVGSVMLVGRRRSWRKAGTLIE